MKLIRPLLAAALVLLGVACNAPLPTAPEARSDAPARANFEAGQHGSGG